MRRLVSPTHLSEKFNDSVKNNLKHLTILQYFGTQENSGVGPHQEPSFANLVIDTVETIRTFCCFFLSKGLSKYYKSQLVANCSILIDIMQLPP